ncbi:MAG TPA: tetratricopeptide repeat protein [Rectinemataceae bacterium]|nr:tetratricopeptide repeat protein [Rectinemataceae bacterium]
MRATAFPATSFLARPPRAGRPASISSPPRRAALTAVLAAAAIAGALASCSSAPKPPDAVYDIRNKAADYAKLGDGFMATGQYDLAEKYFREALQADSSVDDLDGVSKSHTSLGRAYLAAGKPEEARSQFAGALDYGRMAGSGPASSLATSGLGEVSYREGDKEGALALFERAAALAGEDGNSLAVALHDEGVAKAALGRKPEALADLERAASINLGLRRWIELAANRYVMASLFVSENRLEEASAMALSALDADKRAENGRGIAGDLAALAGISTRMDRKSEAWDYWRRCFDSALANGEPVEVRKALTALVALADELGKAADKTRYAAMLAKLDAAQGAELSPGR